MQTPNWYRETPEGIVLLLYIQPRASRTEVVGLHGEPPRLKIRIAAPPVEGEANDEVVRFLKKTLKIPSSQIIILRGDTGRNKEVLCKGMKTEALGLLHKIL
ncbi:DUF167 family protein [Bdellovibrionota bacterium FG-2]